jgi:hypothetical protein
MPEERADPDKCAVIVQMLFDAYTRRPVEYLSNIPNTFSSVHMARSYRYELLEYASEGHFQLVKFTLWQTGISPDDQVAIRNAITLLE